MDTHTESSGIDTSPDMNSSNDFTEDFPSPERMVMLKPRTLIYDESDDPPPLQSGQTFSLNTQRQQIQNAATNDDDDHDQIDGLQNNNVIKPTYRQLSFANQTKMQVESPPYRKVRALRWVTIAVCCLSLRHDEFVPLIDSILFTLQILCFFVSVSV